MYSYYSVGTMFYEPEMTCFWLTNSPGKQYTALDTCESEDGTLAKLDTPVLINWIRTHNQWVSSGGSRCVLSTENEID